MSERLFTKAFFRDLTEARVISLMQISKTDYDEIYKGKLFCPNPECSAKLKYVERNQGTVKLLSAIDISAHIKNCPYYSEYKKYDSDEKLAKSFSIEHIQNVLKRQMRKLGASEDIVKRSKINISNDSKKNAKQTEPHIKSYLCDEVCRELVGKPFCISGIVDSVRIVNKDGIKKHAYINFVTKDETKVSVLINTRLYGSDSKIEEYINEISEKYFSIKHQNSKKYYCSCFGRIDEVLKGYNVVPAIIEAVNTFVLDNN